MGAFGTFIGDSSGTRLVVVIYSRGLHKGSENFEDSRFSALPALMNVIIIIIIIIITIAVFNKILQDFFSASSFIIIILIMASYDHLVS